MQPARAATLTTSLALIVATLSGCSDATGSDAPTSTAPSASGIPELTLSAEFCTTAEQLYARDAALASALASFDLASLTAAESSDPALFAEYVEAMQLDQWDSWRALYVQAADEAAGTEMADWIDAILTSQDALYEIYAQAASETDDLVSWSARVSALVDERAEEVQAIGTAALDASQASLAECDVPLSVYAGDLLGYAPAEE